MIFMMASIVDLKDFGFGCEAEYSDCRCHGACPTAHTAKIHLEDLTAAREEIRLAEQQEKDGAALTPEQLKEAEAYLALRAACLVNGQAQDEKMAVAEAALAQAKQAQTSEPACGASTREAESEEEPQRLKEVEKMRLEQQEKRQKAVTQFLQMHGFSGVNSAKVFNFGMCKTYPLHKAAQLADERLVAYLLAEGANVEQRDKSYSGTGQTALEYVAKANRKGSHAMVLTVLRDAVKLVSTKQLTVSAKTPNLAKPTLLTASGAAPPKSG